MYKSVEKIVQQQILSFQVVNATRESKSMVFSKFETRIYGYNDMIRTQYLNHYPQVH